MQLKKYTTTQTDITVITKSSPCSLPTQMIPVLMVTSYPSWTVTSAPAARWLHSPRMMNGGALEGWLSAWQWKEMSNYLWTSFCSSTHTSIVLPKTTEAKIAAVSEWSQKSLFQLWLMPEILDTCLGLLRQLKSIMPSSNFSAPPYYSSNASDLHQNTWGHKASQWKCKLIWSLYLHKETPVQNALTY